MGLDKQSVKKGTEVVGQKAHEDGPSKPHEFLGISKALMEGIYGQAYRLYNTGKYRDAIQLFRLLVMLNAAEPKYCYGLAASFHMLKEYVAAIKAYLICAVMNQEDPFPHFHASDCYLAIHDTKGAITALDSAVARAGNKPEFTLLKDRALLTISSLKGEKAPG